MIGQALRYAPENMAHSDAGHPRIFILRDSGPAAVAIEPGLNDDDYVEVRSGDVKAGDQIIVSERAAASAAAMPPRL